MPDLSERINDCNYEATRFKHFLGEAEILTGEDLRAALDRADRQLTIVRQSLRLVRSAAVPRMTGKAVKA